MKKLVLPLLLLLGISMLLAQAVSEPSEVVGYVKYDVVEGLNFVALPLESGFELSSEVGDAYPGQIEAISYWDAATQSWFTSQYYEELLIWDPEFNVAPGTPLMISALNDLSFYSIGSLPATNAQYSLVEGLNAIMLPLNKSELELASMVGDDIATVEAISYWDSSSQSWFTAQYYEELLIWDPEFDTSIGNALMISSTAEAMWPSGVRSNNNLSNSK